VAEAWFRRMEDSSDRENPVTGEKVAAQAVRHDLDLPMKTTTRHPNS